MKKTILLALSLLPWALPASAWGPKGHDVTACIAECNLTPEAAAEVDRVLNGYSPVYWSNWLDAASHTPEYAYSKTWHYLNIDEGETLIAIQKREEEERKAKLTANRGAVVVGGDDTRLLAALIYCEAGIETYNGKLAVGAVVMNRVRSAAYPNTISGVIFASGQFTPALNGKVARVYGGDIPESCWEAARAAINGETNVGDATHFRRAGNHDGLLIDRQVFW